MYDDHSLKEFRTSVLEQRNKEMLFVGKLFENQKENVTIQMVTNVGSIYRMWTNVWTACFRAVYGRRHRGS